MAIITLTSDWGLSDFYVGSVKGTILSMDEGINIVDITHCIPKYNIHAAAFVLKNSYSCFPKGTIHIIAVETEEGKSVDDNYFTSASNYDMCHIAVEYDGHYFICTDNGILDLMFGNENVKEVYDLDIEQDSESYTFSTRFRFVKAAVMLAHGTPVSELGRPHLELRQFSPIQPTITKTSIGGHVIYIDSYDNAITNISRELFEREQRGRRFTINVPCKIGGISSISSGYKDVPEGEIVAIWGSHGFLEIAQNHAPYAQLNGVEQSNGVTITFEGE